MQITLTAISNNEMEMVNRKLDRLGQEIKSNKRKLLNSDETLSKYAKH